MALEAAAVRAPRLHEPLELTGPGVGVGASYDRRKQHPLAPGVLLGRFSDRRSEALAKLRGERLHHPALLLQAPDVRKVQADLDQADVRGQGYSSVFST